MPSARGQYKNWVFTLNNPTYVHKATLLFRVQEFTYVIYGEEVGEKGTPHLQGYFELDKKKTLKGLKDLLKSYQLTKIHFESRMGSQAQAIAYCQKDGEWVARGNPCKQGARTDLDQCRRDAQENGMKSVSKWGNLQTIKTAELFLKYNDKPRFAPNDMEVTYIWGKSGTGKTTKAYELLGGDLDNIYTWDCASMGAWWEGYDGEDMVVMDDLTSETVNPKALLTYLGGFPVRAPCKGGSRQLKATKIVITTLKPPKEFWEGHSLKGEEFMQFERRLTKVINLTATHGRAAELEANSKKVKVARSDIKLPKICGEDPSKIGSKKSGVILGDEIPKDPGPSSWEDDFDKSSDGELY